jgi:hypothetical protein
VDFEDQAPTVLIPTWRSLNCYLIAHIRQLLAQAPGASMARDIGFRFGAAPAGGQPTVTEPVSYPAASFAFTWSAANRRWLVSMDGTRAGTADDGQPMTFARGPVWVILTAR